MGVVVVQYRGPLKRSRLCSACPPPLLTRYLVGSFWPHFPYKAPRNGCKVTVGQATVGAVALVHISEALRRAEQLESHVHRRAAVRAQPAAAQYSTTTTNRTIFSNGYGSRQFDSLCCIPVEVRCSEKCIYCFILLANGCTLYNQKHNIKFSLFSEG